MFITNDTIDVFLGALRLRPSVAVFKDLSTVSLRTEALA